MKNCTKFVKTGGGRGRPPYNAQCTECGVIYTDHPNPSRDRYSLAQGILGVTSITSGAPQTIPGLPATGIIPIKV